jgi:hypothetical protein
VRLNELHARICDAQATTLMIKQEKIDKPSRCPSDPCSFASYTDAYYNPKSKNNNIKKWLPLIILASILAALTALFSILLCCCCCPCCPLAAWLLRRRRRREVFI